MPYVTPKMVKFMQDKGISSSTDDSSASKSADDIVSDGSDVSEVDSEIKKIRELPSSVDPCEESEGQETPKQKKRSSSKLANERKSSRGNRAKGGKTLSRSSSRGAQNRTSRRKKPTSAKSTDKKRCRVVNATSMALKPLKVPGMNYEDMSFDEKKVRFIAALLKSNVKRLYEIPPTVKVDENVQTFEAYRIEEKNKFPGKPHSAKAINEAKHAEFDDFLLVCKQYDSSKYLPKRSFFFKVLRHLGKKHPNVIPTWDVMLKGSTIYVFQELAPHGDLLNYVNKKNVFDDEQGQAAARQLRNALDFLGDMGVAHRAIKPAHVLISHITDYFQIKLTGFQSAIIYYNIKKENINYQTCLPIDKKGKEPDYQAPEVYGNASKEQFDPTAADVWSFGATIYYALCKKYPYDFSKENSKIENEIQKNILTLKLSKNGQSAIGHMLTIESTKRLSVEKLKEHPWIKEK